MRNVIAILMLLLPMSALAGAGLTYFGRLLKPDGTAVASNSVKFKIQIRTPGAENCLLYQETHVIDMSSSEGVFAVTVNDGTATVVNTEPFSIDRAFQNRGTFSFAGGKCSAGNSYAPNPTDGRKIAVEFDDGLTGGWEPLPAQAINFVPMAMESMTVGGYGSGSMLRVNDGTGAPAAISALTPTQYNSFLDLLSGSSSLYLTSSSSLNGANLASGSVDDTKLASGITGSKISGNISGNAAGFTGSLNGDVTGTQSATVVGKIQGRAVDSAAPTNGQVLKWSSGNSRWEPSADSTGASGTVTSVTGTGSVVMTGTATDPIVGVQDASSSQKGVVQLATSGQNAANVVVQGNDSRLSDARTPTAHHHNVDEIDSAVGKYFLYKPNNAQCSDGQVLKWINANQRWECANDAGAAGTVASLTANSPIVKTGTSSDPIITVQDASTSQKGAVQLGSSSDTTANLVVQTNDTRLSDSRTPNGSASGDLTNNYPNPTVAKIRGKDVSATAPSASGQVLRYDSSVGSGTYVPGFLSLADIRSTVTIGNTMFPATTCSASQTLTWSSLTDTMVCANIAGLDAGVLTGGVLDIARLPTGTTGATVALGNDSRFTDSRAPNGAASGDLAGNYPNPTLAPAGTAGTYTKVTTDSKGRVTSGSAQIDYGDVTNAAGKYLNYKPNNSACADTDLLKWDNTNSRWVCQSQGSLSATNATNFTGSLVGDVTGTQGATVVSTVGGVTAANVASGANAANAAVSTNTISTIVKRDSSGNFSAGTITANLTGNVTGNLTGNVTGNVSGTAANVTGTVAVANGGTGTTTGSITGSGALTFTAGGTNQNVTLAPSGTGSTILNGNVGIGTASPWSRLHVDSPAGTNNILTMHRSANTDQNLIWMQGSSALAAATPAWVTGMEASSNDYFVRTWDGTTSAARLTIQANSGNVGIGTTSPSGVLHAVSTSTASPRGIISEQVTSDAFGAQFNALKSRGTVGSPSAVTSGDTLGTFAARGWDGSAYGVAGYVAISAEQNFSGSVRDANMLFYTASGTSVTEKMRITSTGNVGIGTTAPAQQLDVTSPTLSTATVNVLSMSRLTRPPTPAVKWGNSAEWALGSYSTNLNAESRLDLKLSNGATNSPDMTAMTWLANGNVGIGTTLPRGPLHIKHPSGTYNPAAVHLEDSTGTSVYGVINSGGDLWIGYNTNSAGGYPQASFSTPLIIKSSGNVGIGTSAPGTKLDVQGGVTNSSGGYTQTSDIRLKTNIEYLGSDEALTKILNLRGIYYDWKDQEKMGHEHQIGVIAQDVQKTFPEAVRTNSEGILSVSYSNLVAPIIESIKALYYKVAGIDREIASVKAENAQLKAKNQELEMKLTQQEAEIKARLDKIEKMLKSK